MISKSSENQPDQILIEVFTENGYERKTLEKITKK